MILLKQFIYCLCGLLVYPLASAAPAPVFQLSDLQKLVSLNNPQISPDGKQIAVVMSTPDWKTNKNKQEIDLVNVASGVRRALTWQREELSSPRWSPDGKRLAFLAKDAETKKPQLFIMPMDGGDAQRITDNKQGVLEFTWSPDGSQVAFVAQDPPINEKAIKEHDDVFQVTDGNFQLRAAVAPWHLWLVPSSGGIAKQLTQGGFSLQTDQEGATPLVWSHDGHRILFTEFPNPYWGPSFRSVIAQVDVNGGAPQTLVSAQGAVRFTYSPDSDDFAFMRSRNGDQNNGDAVYVNVDGKTRDATQAQARNFNFYHWMPDGKNLLLGGDYGTTSVLWRQPVEGNARRLDLGDVNVDSEVSVAKDGVLAFIGITGSHPDELYVMDSSNAKPRRLTDVNGFVDSLTLGRVVPITWNGPDGFREDGVLIYPANYQSGKKYPLVLEIHGGPEGASTVIFSPLPQLLAAAGFRCSSPITAAASIWVTPTSMRSSVTPAQALARM